MSKQQKGLIITGVLLFFLICIVYHFSFRESVATVADVLELNISLESGFYTENQVLTAVAPEGTRIFYTEDYSIPNEETGILYETPIDIAVDEEVMLYTYRFKAYYPDGQESDVVTRTFFTGKQVDSRYTTKVLHLTGEPEELFGYERGIFEFGKLFDDFIAKNPDAHLGGGIEANFELRGKESERAVYIECFDAEGDILLRQNGGIRIYGETTRLKNQKSFKLYARKEYDIQDEFRYPIISKLLSAVDGTVAQKHERLVVRSGGTDNGYGYIRSELVAELASQAGFPDVMHSEAICVYINGQYRGIYWLSNAYDELYFETRYGEYTGEFVVLGGIDVQKEDDPEVQTYVDEYNELYALFSAMDLTEDGIFNALNQVLDVENYLQYFAIQNYVGNWDSIDNNLKVYRYVDGQDDYAESGAFDGRYRHLLFDVDFGFGLIVQYGRFGNGPTHRTLDRFIETSPLFAALMERQECRDYFMSYSCDLMNGAMSYANVSEVLAEKHGARDAELCHMLENTDVQKNSICVEWEGDCIEKYENVTQNYQQILTYAEERPVAALSDLIETFGLSYEDAYTLKVLKQGGKSAVQINSVCMEEDSFEGPYLATIPVELTPKLTANEKFDHWIVNGEVRSEERLILTAKDVQNYCVNVELVVSEKEKPVLQLHAIKAKGNSDYIEIINDSGQAITTQSYYLSDDEGPYKCALPSVTLQPGEVIRLWGKDCTDSASLGGFGLNFDMKQGETISFTYAEEVLETVYIPDMSEGGIYQRDGIGKEFIEVLGE